MGLFFQELSIAGVLAECTPGSASEEPLCFGSILELSAAVCSDDTLARSVSFQFWKTLKSVTAITLSGLPFSIPSITLCSPARSSARFARPTRPHFP